MTVRTAHGVIEIGAGSKVLVETNEQETIVRNLHDHKRGDVVMVANGTALPISLGHQLAVSNDPQGTLQDRSSIATRHTTTYPLSNGLTATISEFSLISAMTNHPILKALAQSADKTERKHVEQILKNAVVLTFATAAKGRYQGR
jgi:hypothetical protein